MLWIAIFSEKLNKCGSLFILVITFITIWVVFFGYNFASLAQRFVKAQLFWIWGTEILLYAGVYLENIRTF